MTPRDEEWLEAALDVAPPLDETRARSLSVLLFGDGGREVAGPLMRDIVARIAEIHTAMESDR